MNHASYGKDIIDDLPDIFESLTFNFVYEKYDFSKNQFGGEVVSKKSSGNITDITCKNWKHFGDVKIRLIHETKNNKLDSIFLSTIDLRDKCVNCQRYFKYADFCRGQKFEQINKIFVILNNEIQKKYGKYNSSLHVQHYDADHPDSREKSFLWNRNGFNVTLTMHKYTDIGCGKTWEVVLHAKRNNR
ncbi:MAG: hypothetical protein JW807_10940 [Spirochaetes bacterium]|nr:hypothetical protein [Spirochaetota bacterium]